MHCGCREVVKVQLDVVGDVEAILWGTGGGWGAGGGSCSKCVGAASGTGLLFGQEVHCSNVLLRGFLSNWALVKGNWPGMIITVSAV